MILTPKLTTAQRVYLDFVRAAAAMSVLVGHASMFFLKGGFLFKADIQTGGVLVFFLISGFLISLSVFQKHADPKYGFGEYFIDRFSRIYCAYLPALIFVAMMDWQIADSPLYTAPDPTDANSVGHQYDVRTWVGNLFMLQHFPMFQILKRLGIPQGWAITPFGSASPFWTISIEWWTYMLFGIVVLVRMRGGKPLNLWQSLLLLFVAIEPVYHFIGGPDRCLTMLWATGMGVSLLYLRLPFVAVRWPIAQQHWRRICLIACGSATAAMIAHLAANIYHLHDKNVAELQFGLFLAAAIFSLFFALGTVKTVPKVLKDSIGFIAAYSYSLYLTHFTLMWTLAIRFPGHEHDRQFFWLSIALSNVLAIAFWWLFERHYLRVAGKMKTLLQAARQEAAKRASVPAHVTPSWSPGKALLSSSRLRPSRE